MDDLIEMELTCCSETRTSCLATSNQTRSNNKLLAKATITFLAFGFLIRSDNTLSSQTLVCYVGSLFILGRLIDTLCY